MQFVSERSQPVRGRAAERAVALDGVDHLGELRGSCRGVARRGRRRFRVSRRSSGERIDPGGDSARAHLNGEAKALPPALARQFDALRMIIGVELHLEPETVAQRLAVTKAQPSHLDRNGSCRLSASAEWAEGRPPSPVTTIVPTGGTDRESLSKSSNWERTRAEQVSSAHNESTSG